MWKIGSDDFEDGFGGRKIMLNCTYLDTHCCFLAVSSKFFSNIHPPATSQRDVDKSLTPKMAGQRYPSILFSWLVIYIYIHIYIYDYVYIYMIICAYSYIYPDFWHKIKTEKYISNCTKVPYPRFTHSKRQKRDPPSKSPCLPNKFSCNVGHPNGKAGPCPVERSPLLA